MARQRDDAWNTSAEPSRATGSARFTARKPEIDAAAEPSRATGSARFTAGNPTSPTAAESRRETAAARLASRKSTIDAVARLMRDSAVPPDAVPDLRPDPADPALLTSPDVTSARVAGGSATAAFGYPAFAPADSGGFEFRSQSWHVGEAGFEQIGDAEVIRRGLAQRPPVPSADWDPLTDPLPATAGRVVHRPEADTQAWDPAAEHTQPIELWATLAEPLDEQRTQPVDLSALFRPEPDQPDDHPSGPLPAAGVWPPVAAVP